jgi:NAD(P)-dependent dehydrogenase (short-subunit alcohol dehydrogenase family)
MSIYELKGKVAIVTGAGSGIGLAVAELLLAAGSLVVFADLSLQPAAELTLKKYSTSSTDKSSPVVIFHKTDVADWSQLNGLWETTLREFGQIDIIANIAGVYEPPFSDFWRPPGISPESKDQPDANPGSYATISINYVAPVRLAQLAIDYWCRNQVKGNFVAVSSIAAYLHSMHTPLYMSSKAALVSFVKSLGELNDHFGFRFAAVCPGTVTVSANSLGPFVSL